MFTRRSILLLLLNLSAVVVQAQVASETTPLTAGQSVERQIAGGESQTYRISINAGQFIRFHLDQRGVDATIVLTAPDGKQLVEMNLTRAGDEESLSLEAAESGEYLLSVRVPGMPSLRGSYALKTDVKSAATAQDKQSIAAEALMIEAENLGPQVGKGAPKIIENMQQVLPVWREQNDVSREAWSLLKIGYAYSDLGQQDKAVETIGQSLSLYRTAKNRSGEGEALLRLGSAYMRLTQYAKAAEQFQNALAIDREIKNRAGEARSLAMIGQTFNYRGETEKAIDYFTPALAILEEVNDRRSQAAALFSLGNSYLGLSKFEKAIEVFEQALSISQEIKNRAFEGAAFANLAAAYGNTFRTEKAIEYLEKALPIFREFNDRPTQVNMLVNLGVNYMNLGQNDKALGYLEEALPISREIKDRVGEGRALKDIGVLYMNQRRFEKAVEFLGSAVAIFQEIKARSWESDTLRALGSTHNELKQFDKAVMYEEQSLAISRELNDRAGIVSSLYQIARAENQLGDLTKAQTAVEEGIKIAESVRSDLQSTQFRSAYLASDAFLGSYRLYTDVLMRRHQAEPTKGFDVLAVEVGERQRARSLLDLLAEAKIDLSEGVDPKLIEREQALAKQLDAKAETQPKTPEQAAALKQEISQLENDYERAQVAVSNASPRYAALTQPQPLKLKEIQAQLDADTVLLEYSLGDDHSYLWAISNDSLKSYQLPNEKLIENNARRVYDAMTARSTNKRGETAAQRQERVDQAEAELPKSTHELSQAILAPVAAQLGNKRLVIVADGALQYIPFAMLPDPSAATGSGQPLIVGHEIVSLPSASTLAMQRTEMTGRPLAPKTLAVIADPVFDRTDPRLKTIAAETADNTKAATNTADARGLEYIAETSDDTTGRLVIRRLPFTRQEADSLLALSPKGSSFVAMDFRASRANILSSDLSQYRYIHFATHGFLDTESPGLSALVLSTVDANGRPQEGFLRSNDIYNMKLPAELVVLSACQTGLGKQVKGEGLIGLTRGFMYAGAKRVVVSLWSVNDKATADLMTTFYRGMLKNNERPSAALRAAQIEMWKQKKWKSPFYWAAFTMQGEWR